MVGYRTHLASTAKTFALVKLSTPNTRPKANVKNPKERSRSHQPRLSTTSPPQPSPPYPTPLPWLRDSPLMPAKTVELPTLVNPNEAFTVQFAANQTIQNVAARCAVSPEVSF